MEKTNEQVNNTPKMATTPTSNNVGASQERSSQASRNTSGKFDNNRGGGDRRGGRPRAGGPRDSKERVKPEFDTKIINIRRVTRVASGGRRFSFSVAVVSGDRKGRVGVGLGKAGDTSIAIDKATRDAKKNMIKINLTGTMSIPHPVKAKYCSARVLIMPAPGRGVIAGSSVRNVIELGGVKDVSAKLLSGSKNKLNNARVALKALSNITKNIKPSQLKAPAATSAKTSTPSSAVKA